MSNTLRIHFTGLVLFAPEHGKEHGTGKMHVLFPATTGDVGHSHGVPHIARLMFDSAHLRPNSTGMSGRPVTVLLDHVVLTLPGNEANLDLCRQIVNLKDVGGVVHEDQFGMDRRKRLAGRVTLGRGSNDGVEPGLCWRWNGKVRPITHRVQWTIPFGESMITLERQGLHGHAENRFLQLHPVAGEIPVVIYHLPANQTPWDEPTATERAEGRLPDHFQSLYHALDDYGPLAFPEFVSESGCGAEGYQCAPIEEEEGNLSTFARWGGTPFNCMGGGVYP
jgi:hypothetical protein